jgi:hypothetical protein
VKRSSSNNESSTKTRPFYRARFYKDMRRQTNRATGIVLPLAESEQQLQGFSITMRITG